MLPTLLMLIFLFTEAGGKAFLSLQNLLFNTFLCVCEWAHVKGPP